MENVKTGIDTNATPGQLPLIAKSRRKAPQVISKRLPPLVPDELLPENRTVTEATI